MGGFLVTVIPGLLIPCHRLSGLFRGLSPSRTFHFLRHIWLLAQSFSPVVLRSIPSAASTFAAFEITRGMAVPPSLAFAELTQELTRIPQGLDWRVTPCKLVKCNLAITRMVIRLYGERHDIIVASRVGLLLDQLRLTTRTYRLHLTQHPSRPPKSVIIHRTGILQSPLGHRTSKSGHLPSPSTLDRWVSFLRGRQPWSQPSLLPHWMGAGRQPRSWWWTNFCSLWSVSAQAPGVSSV